MNWQQRDLAKAARLSLSAVNTFEREIGEPRPKTVQAMVGALVDAGIEFLPGGGLRHTDEVASVQHISGKNFIEKMNEDVFATVRKPGVEILTCSTDESQWFAPDVKKYSDRYFEWRKRMSIKEYYLVAEANTVFESPRHHYRVLPEAMIGKITYFIYGNKIAFVLWRKKQVFILRSSHLVEPFREQFKFLWRQAKKA